MGMGEKLEAYRKNMAELSQHELPHPTQITPESIQEKFINSILGGEAQTLSSNSGQPVGPNRNSLMNRQDTTTALQGEPDDASAQVPVDAAHFDAESIESRVEPDAESGRQVVC